MDFCANISVEGPSRPPLQYGPILLSNTQTAFSFSVRRRLHAPPSVRRRSELRRVAAAGVALLCAGSARRVPVPFLWRLGPVHRPLRHNLVEWRCHVAPDCFDCVAYYFIGIGVDETASVAPLFAKTLRSRSSDF